MTASPEGIRSLKRRSKSVRTISRKAGTHATACRTDPGRRLRLARRRAARRRGPRQRAPALGRRGGRLVVAPHRLPHRLGPRPRHPPRQHRVLRRSRARSTTAASKIGKGGYVYAPKGVPIDYLKVAEGTKILHYREYGDAGFDAGRLAGRRQRWADAREDVIVIDSDAMKWDAVPNPGPMPGLFIKYLHVDPVTGFYTRLVHAAGGLVGPPSRPTTPATRRRTRPRATWSTTSAPWTSAPTSSARRGSSTATSPRWRVAPPGCCARTASWPTGTPRTSGSAGAARASTTAPTASTSRRTRRSRWSHSTHDMAQPWRTDEDMRQLTASWQFQKDQGQYDAPVAHHGSGANKADIAIAKALDAVNLQGGHGGDEHTHDHDHDHDHDARTTTRTTHEPPARPRLRLGLVGSRHRARRRAHRRAGPQLGRRSELEGGRPDPRADPLQPAGPQPLPRPLGRRRHVICSDAATHAPSARAAGLSVPGREPARRPSDDKGEDAERSEDDGYDVVVVGAGTAGIPCAISAAQGGARVLLVEKDSPDRRHPAHHRWPHGRRRHPAAGRDGASWTRPRRTSTTSAGSARAPPARTSSGSWSSTPPRPSTGSTSAASPSRPRPPGSSTATSPTARAHLLRRRRGHLDPRGAPRRAGEGPGRARPDAVDEHAGHRDPPGRPRPGDRGRRSSAAAGTSRSTRRGGIATGGFGADAELFEELEGVPAGLGGAKTSTGDGIHLGMAVGAAAAGRGHLPADLRRAARPADARPGQLVGPAAADQRASAARDLRRHARAALGRRGRAVHRRQGAGADRRSPTRPSGRSSTTTRWSRSTGAPPRWSSAAEPDAGPGDAEQPPGRARAPTRSPSWPRWPASTRRAWSRPCRATTRPSPTGEDPEFGRKHLPAPIAQAPFYAIRNHAHHPGHLHRPRHRRPLRRARRGRRARSPACTPSAR